MNQATENNIQGLHHVTALAAGPQRNLDFYAGVLGLRMVKKTVNFDAPQVYHLYYGDELGQPGTIMTFFPFGSDTRKGRPGKGQLTRTAFSIAEDSVGYWLDRLKAKGIAHEAPTDRFEETVIALEDYDGLPLELVANAADKRPGFSYGPIPLAQSVKGFYGVTLSVGAHQRTHDLLVNQLGHELVQESGHRFRLTSDQVPGGFVDLLDDPQEPQGIEGGGTVHHVAFATPTDASQLAVRETLLKQGYQPTPVIDRQYFHSIYFREPNGILFEVATNPPGFTLDEPQEELGQGLKLPAQYEGHRKEISQLLEPISLEEALGG